MRIPVFFSIRRKSDGKYLYGFEMSRRSFKGDFAWVIGMENACRFTLQQASALINAFYTISDTERYEIDCFDTAES